MANFERSFDVLKVDGEQRVVFGWASVVEEHGFEVQDTQGDVISEEEIENAAFDFVMNAREGHAMHKGENVATLCASLVFTKQIQKLLGISTEVGWLVGFHVHDDEIWKMVKSGELPMFSIGGEAHEEAA